MVGEEMDNMAKIKRYTQADGHYHNELAFFCPGCKCKHFLNDKLTTIPELTQRHIWVFNNNFERPTIQPSYLTRGYRLNPETEKYDIETDRCHSFITDGMIQFLSDCQHEMAGLTVELPDIH